LPQLRKWINNLEATARAQLEHEAAAGEPAPVEPALLKTDCEAAPGPKLSQLPFVSAAAPLCVEIPVKKQPGSGGDNPPFDSLLSDIEISLCAPSPPDSPQYGSSCSSSTCASPASPKAADFRLTPAPLVDATVLDDTLINRGVLAWRHHLAALHQSKMAIAQPSPAGLSLGAPQMAFAIAQALPVGDLGRVLPTACVQECSEILDLRANGKAHHADEERDISDAMLMDALLDDDAILDEVSSSSGWVEDWLFDFVNGDR
jgi:hypothetical protein